MSENLAVSPLKILTTCFALKSLTLVFALLTTTTTASKAYSQISLQI